MKRRAFFTKLLGLLGIPCIIEATARQGLKIKGEDRRVSPTNLSEAIPPHRHQFDPLNYRCRICGLDEVELHRTGQGVLRIWKINPKPQNIETKYGSRRNNDQWCTL